jgi:hypothetical protein
MSSASVNILEAYLKNDNLLAGSMSPLILAIQPLKKSMENVP